MFYQLLCRQPQAVLPLMGIGTNIYVYYILITFIVIWQKNLPKYLKNPSIFCKSYTLSFNNYLPTLQLPNLYLTSGFAASPQRGGAPPNHQVQLCCDTWGASPHFLEKKNHATSNSLMLDNVRKAQTKKLFILP